MHGYVEYYIAFAINFICVKGVSHVGLLPND